jgi:hypothetical protein
VHDTVHSGVKKIVAYPPQFDLATSQLREAIQWALNFSSPQTWASLQRELPFIPLGADKAVQQFRHSAWIGNEQVFPLTVLT